MSNPTTMFTVALLLISTVTMVSCIRAPSPSPSPQPAAGLQLVDLVLPVEILPAAYIENEEVGIGFPLPTDPSASACWKTIQGTQGCARDIIQSWITFQVKLSPDCCNAILGIGPNCFQSIFGGLPAFAPLIQSFCSAGSH